MEEDISNYMITNDSEANWAQLYILCQHTFLKASVVVAASYSH